VEALTFADQIIVMYEGQIVQIGTPQDLFEYPNHKFVGYFIGSPGMNFLPCAVENGKARVGECLIPLDDRTAALGSRATGTLELGIRPLYLKIHVQEIAGSFQVPVQSVEDQGSYRVVTLAFADQVIRARIAENDPVPGSTAWISFPEKWIRLFENDHLLK
jgi:glycerol transport system ATP-binding protein